MLGEAGDESGIANAGLLIEFAEAAVGADAARLDAAREALIATMGEAALSDTAAVAALFNAIDRVADATGIPLEDEKAVMAENLRNQLGIDWFGQVPTRQEAVE